MSDVLEELMDELLCAESRGWAETFRIMQRAIDEITALRAEVERLRNPWVSVEDELPDEGVVVAAMALGKGVRDLYIWDGEWFNVPYTWTDGVTHWQPTGPIHPSPHNRRQKNERKSLH